MLSSWDGILPEGIMPNFLSNLALLLNCFRCSRTNHASKRAVLVSCPVLKRLRSASDLSVLPLQVAEGVAGAVHDDATVCRRAVLPARTWQL